MIVSGWNLEYHFRPGKEEGFLVGMAMYVGMRNAFSPPLGKKGPDVPKSGGAGVRPGGAFV